jgi:3-deoxy-manno-octulosonate cytidylyltransferase (CMP-KDO synthetase)
MADVTVAVIPARHGATRFPGKLLAELAGRPVVHHVVRAALAARVDRVVVATDDVRIAEVAERAGAEAYRSRLEHATGSDRVGEAVRALGLGGATVVNVQGDEPLLPSSAIDACVERLETDVEADIATLASPMRVRGDEPSVVKVVVTPEGRALYFSRSPIPWSDGAEPARLQHVGVYAFRAGALERFLRAPRGCLEQTERLEQLRALECGMKIGVSTIELDVVGVDVPEDIERAEAVLARRRAGSGVID